MSYTTPTVQDNERFRASNYWVATSSLSHSKCVYPVTLPLLAITGGAIDLPEVQYYRQRGSAIDCSLPQGRPVNGHQSSHEHLRRTKWGDIRRSGCSRLDHHIIREVDAPRQQLRLLLALQ